METDNKTLCLSWQNTSRCAEILAPNNTDNITSGNASGLSPFSMYTNQGVTGEMVAATVLRVLAIILGSFGNISVFLIFLRTKRLQTWANAFHVNLAVFDLMMCALVSPMGLVADWSHFLGFNLLSLHCYKRNLAALVATGNILTLAQIASLRCNGLHYPDKPISKRNVLPSIVLSWVVGVIAIILSFLSKPGGLSFLFCPSNSTGGMLPAMIITVYTVGVFVVSIGVLIRSYSRIVLKIRQQNRLVAPYSSGYYVARVNLEQLSVITDASDIFSVEMSTLGPQPPTQNVQMSTLGPQPPAQNVQSHYASVVLKERRVIINSVLLLAIFFLSYIPITVGLVHLAVSQSLFGSKNPQDTVKLLLSFALINYTVNPYLYTLRSVSFQKGFKRLYRRRKINPDMNVTNFL